MQTFTVGVFATDKTPYVDIAEKNIIKSLKTLNIGYHFAIVPNLGSWQKNTSFKPSFAYAMLEAYDNNVVLLDADCEVKKYPELFDNIPEQYDVAAYTLSMKEWYRNGTIGTELLSGTLFLRNNEKVRELVGLWITNCQKEKIWEQKVLQKAILELNIQVYPLPVSYCYIATLPNGNPPYVECKDPYIVHYQASREYKRKINV